MADIEKYHKPGSLEPSQGLNSFLQGASEAGAHQSEGEFTVSLDRALDKLEKFQLSDPNLFILNLVSVAVLLKATYFNASFTADQARVDFDGEHLSLDQLKTLWIGSEPALKELSVALSAAKALNYKALLFQSGGAVRWEADGKPEFIDVEGKHNSLTLYFSRSLGNKLFGKFQSIQASTPRWFAPLRRSCQFAPLTIKAGHYSGSMNSFAIYPPVWYCRNPGFRFPRMVTIGETGANLFELPATEDFSAVIGSTANPWAKEWNFVYRGITYTRSTSSVDLGGLGGVVYSEALTKDISHTDVVQNEAFDRIVEELKQMTTSFIRDELCAEFLPPNRIYDWGKAALWAGKRLYDEGNNRDAARVEAWAYGHLTQRWHSDRRPSLDPLSRYEEPLVFLVDYLHWSGRVNLEDKIRVFSQEPTLAPWLAGADTRSLGVLFNFLRPRFPQEIGWDMVEPLVQRLVESELADETLEALKERFQSIASESVALALRSILRVASFLTRHGKLDFEEWLKRSLKTGYLPCTGGILESLTGTPVEGQAQTIVDEFLGSKKTSAMLKATGEFQSYLREPGYTALVTIQKHLDEALRNTNTRSENLDIQALIGVFYGDVKSPSSTDFAWETHRAALLYGILERKSVAYELHLKAHVKLEKHWFSHLLLGDASLALNMDSAAHLHYTQALALEPNSLSAKEAFIETSPSEEQLELWIAHAQSVATHEVEDALAYREALALCPATESFATWVKLRALTSLAEHQAGKTLPRVDESLFFKGEAVQVSFLHPAVVRYVIRRIRNKWPLAGPELPRLRLTSMLSRSTSALLRWKEEYLDSEETRL